MSLCEVFLILLVYRVFLDIHIAFCYKAFLCLLPCLCHSTVLPSVDVCLSVTLPDFWIVFWDYLLYLFTHCPPWTVTAQYAG